MAKIKRKNYLLVGLAAGAAAYVIYGQYQQYVAKKKLDALKAGGTPAQVLETLTTSSPTTGSGSATVTVTEPAGTTTLLPCETQFPNTPDFVLAVFRLGGKCT